MKYLDFTFPMPEENLACDEALLNLCESGYEHEILRFWEAKQYFVVLGFSKPTHQETHRTYCHKHDIPILRRCSGGGTILQGPGCLNYAIILNINRQKSLKSITGTNQYMMETHKRIFQALTERMVTIQGITDLALDSNKFSGNAQKRKKNFLLFHGTLLLKFDINLLSKTLKHPSLQPEYRKNRIHNDFIINLDLSEKTIKNEFKNTWKAHEPFNDIPHESIQTLVNTKYKNKDWNEKL